MKMTFKKRVWIIPVLSLLVIFESVFIVKLMAVRKKEVASETSVQVDDNLNYAAKINLIGNSQVRRGEVENVKVVLSAEEELILDGADVYLRYDSAGLEILTVKPTTEFSVVGRNWIEPENERILLSLVETQENGQVNLEKGQKLILADITYQAILDGKVDVEIYKAGEARGTVLAGKGKEYDFITEDLTISVE